MCAIEIAWVVDASGPSDLDPMACITSVRKSGELIGTAYVGSNDNDGLRVDLKLGSNLARQVSIGRQAWADTPPVVQSFK